MSTPRIVRIAIVGLALALLSNACDESSPSPPLSKTATPSPSSTDGGQAGKGTSRIVIEREQPDGPLFIEGSAAYAVLYRVRSDETPLRGYFDVPGTPGSKGKWPARLRGPLAPGRYELEAHQRPCDASACSQTGPTGWGAPTLRCDTRLRVARKHVVLITIVVEGDGCRFKIAAYNRGETG